MPSKKQDPFEKIVQRMDELEEEFQDWPEWKKADLEERLKEVPVPVLAASANRTK